MRNNGLFAEQIAQQKKQVIAAITTQGSTQQLDSLRLALRDGALRHLKDGSHFGIFQSLFITQFEEAAMLCGEFTDGVIKLIEHFLADKIVHQVCACFVLFGEISFLRMTFTQDGHGTVADTGVEVSLEKES